MEYDLTRPSTSRMYDYWLGGNHHFEIDRQFADRLEQQFPFMRQFCAEERAFTGRCVNFLHRQGLRVILDFGASLPTCGNTHLAAHALDPEIKVVYSDIDPITSQYGNELLRGTPNVIYLMNDASYPQGVLSAPETQSLLNGEQRIGILFNALAHLMNDEQLRAAWRALFDWAAHGSFMSVSVPSADWLVHPETAPIIEIYRRSGLASYMRTRDQYAALISPWQLTQEGMVENLAWGLPSQGAQSVLFFSMMLCK
jgi:hypothetical protein